MTFIPQGRTALFCSTAVGNLPATRSLLKHGANVNTRNSRVSGTENQLDEKERFQIVVILL